MGLIYKQLRMQGNLGEREVNTLFDTGSSRCLIRRDIAQEVATLSESPRRLRFQTASGILETQEAITSTVWVEGHPLLWIFIVAPELPEELILGADFFQVWKIRLDPEREEITIDPSALELKLL